MPSPSTPLAYQILSALKTRFAVPVEGSTYWHTLSGTGQVIIGEPDQLFPAQASRGMVFLRIDSNPREFGEIRTMTSETLNVVGWMVVPFLADTTEARTLAITKGYQDLTTTLETDMSLGGLLIDALIVNMRDLAGDGMQLPARLAAFSFEVRCRYWRGIGGGQ